MINPSPLHAHLIKKSSTVKQGKKKKPYVPVRSDDESVEDGDVQPEEEVVKRGPPAKKRNVKPPFNKDGGQSNTQAGPSCAVDEIPNAVKLGLPTRKRKPDWKPSKKNVDISPTSPGPFTKNKAIVLMPPSMGGLVSFYKLISII